MHEFFGSDINAPSRYLVTASVSKILYAAFGRDSTKRVLEYTIPSIRTMISAPPSAIAQATTTWETLNTMSFNGSVYVSCLKLSITCGSFILYYNKTDDDAPRPQVGRVLEVVSSIDMVPQSDHFPAIQEQFQKGSATSRDEIPVQFLKVNVFKNRELLPDRYFPVDVDNTLLSKISPHTLLLSSFP